MLNDWLKPIVFSMARLDRVKNITGMVECCTKNAKTGFSISVWLLTAGAVLLLREGRPCIRINLPKESTLQKDLARRNLGNQNTSIEGLDMEDKSNIQIPPFTSIVVPSSLDDQEENDFAFQPSVLSQQFSSWKLLLKYLVIFVDNLAIWCVYLMNMDPHSASGQVLYRF